MKEIEDEEDWPTATIPILSTWACNHDQVCILCILCILMSDILLLSILLTNSVLLKHSNEIGMQQCIVEYTLTNSVFL